MQTEEMGKIGSMRSSRSLGTSFRAQTQIFPAGLGVCSITELRRVSLGLTHTLTKLAMNLNPKQDRLELEVDG